MGPTRERGERKDNQVALITKRPGNRDGISRVTRGDRGGGDQDFFDWRRRVEGEGKKKKNTLRKNSPRKKENTIGGLPEKIGGVGNMKKVVGAGKKQGAGISLSEERKKKKTYTIKTKENKETGSTGGGLTGGKERPMYKSQESNAGRYITQKNNRFGQFTADAEDNFRAERKSSLRKGSGDAWLSHSNNTKLQKRGFCYSHSIRFKAEKEPGRS